MIHPEQATRSARIEAVKQLNETVHDYTYDDKGQWCEISFKFHPGMGRLLFVSLVENIAPKIIVRHTPGIKRCILGKSSQVRYSYSDVKNRPPPSYPKGLCACPILHQVSFASYTEYSLFLSLFPEGGYTRRITGGRH